MNMACKFPEMFDFPYLQQFDGVYNLVYTIAVKLVISSSYEFS